MIGEWTIRAAVVAASVALCFTPLANILGYESAAAAGVFCGLAALVRTHLRVGRTVPDPLARDRARSTIADFGALLPGNAALVAVPLALLTLNALRVRNCDPLTGALFFLLIPLVSVLVGQTVAWIAALVPRRSLRVPLALALIAADVAWLLWRLATEPPITGHTWLLGWFAGSIYDEALSIPTSLIWVRLTLVAGCAVVVLAIELLARRSRSNSGGLTLALLVTALITGGLHAQSLAAGAWVDRAQVFETLGGRLETEHFVIHYDPASLDETGAALLATDHEYRYAELAAFFDEDPVAWRGRRISSVVYPDKRTQHALMGARNTLVARPWTHEMHIRWDDIGDTAVAHELAHLFTAPFGGGPLQLATRDVSLIGGLVIDIGLVEGIALAADWPPDELTPHEAAAAMRALDIAPDLRRLFDPAGFWSQPSGKAYTLMGSFVRHLVDTGGIATFKAAYRTGDFQDAYGQSVDELISGWEAAIDAISVSDDALELARFRYKRKSIFGKVCARTIADLDRRARQAQSRRELDRALSLREEILGHEPGRPGHHLDLARLLREMDRQDEAVSVVDGVIERGLKPVHRSRALELRGDLLWELARPETADEDYARCLAFGVPDATRRRLEAKRAGLASAEARDIAQTYLLGGLSRARVLFAALRWVETTPDDPLPRYLAGLQLTRLREWESALRYLDGPPDTLPWPVMDERRRLTQARAFLLLGRLDEADAVYAGLVDSPRSRTASIAREGRARVTWSRATPAR